MSKLSNTLRSIYHALPEPPTTLYPSPIKRRIEAFAELPDDALIFDIGSKNARETYGFPNLPSNPRFVRVDIEDGPGVDLVADAHDLHAVEENSVDCIFCVSVLEHVFDPSKVVSEMYRILKPGGLVYVNVPFLFPFHADPDDYRRYTVNGIKLLMSEFHCLDANYSRGPASTMHHLLVHFFAIAFSLNNRTLYGINVDLFKWLLFWVKYFDKFIGAFDMAHIVSTGSYFIGEKRVSD
ncbi:MAG: class I SAM-dependent methyltransferase [Pseudomonadota bacterium]